MPCVTVSVFNTHDPLNFPTTRANVVLASDNAKYLELKEITD